MTAPPRTDPPYVRSGTPHGRAAAPRGRSSWPELSWSGAAVVVGLAHRPSQAQRAADLRGFLTDVTADIQSCAGGVSESLTALHAVQSGTTGDVPTAVNIADTGAANCSPANNELLDDLEEYQVTESLSQLPAGQGGQRAGDLGSARRPAGAD